MTPLAIDQWGWTKEDAIMYLGITMASGGVLSGLCFATIGPLSKKLDERLLLLFAGIVPMIIGRVIMFPMGSEYPVSSYRPPNTTTMYDDDSSSRGLF
jgi:ceroid-lipofuscinosis MFS transporter 7